MSMTIIFYDIPSTLPGSAWSPNTWKARYSLNFKGLDYKTEWIEYPDIEAHCLKFGIEATSIKADGKPRYTLPVIHNPTTGAYISDSWDIAVYLETTYPNTPPLFPSNTIGLQLAYSNAYMSCIDAIWHFILPRVTLILNPPSSEYFRRTNEKTFGMTMEDLVPKGEKGVAEWAKYQAGLSEVESWYAKSSGPFLLGDAPSWADFFTAAYLIRLRIAWGEDSEQWKDVTSWNSGRWKKLVADLEKYETIL